MPRNDTEILKHYSLITQHGSTKIPFETLSAAQSTRQYKQEILSNSYTKPLALMISYSVKRRAKKGIVLQILDELQNLLPIRKTQQLAKLIQTFPPLPQHSRRPVVIKKLDEFSVFSTAEILNIIKKADLDIYNFVSNHMKKFT